MKTMDWVMLVISNSWTISGLIWEGLMLQFRPRREVRVAEATSGRSTDR